MELLTTMQVMLDLHGLRLKNVQLELINISFIGGKSDLSPIREFYKVEESDMYRYFKRIVCAILNRKCNDDCTCTENK